MKPTTRRALLTAGLGVAGVAAGNRLAAQAGLIPPDGSGIYGPGETLTYAAHRLLGNQRMAREFPREMISAKPFVNGKPFSSDAYRDLARDGFAQWRLKVDGLVAQPMALSLADLKGLPARSQITHLACEEGWSYIAEWTGVPLRIVLERAGILPQAKFVVYTSLEPYWSDSIDMADALHPQTLIAYGMNGGDLPHGHGGPLRLRVPRQLAYKSVKYIHRLLVTDRPEVAWTGGDYAWYAGI